MAGRTGNLGKLAQLFLKLGIIGFGGPAAHIALMETEVVNKRQWLAREQFLDLLGATNLIPGPNSTEMAIHIGYTVGRFPGLMIAGACFIVPAVTITGILAWLYVQYGSLPEVQPLLYGIKPVVLVIILEALWRLGKKAVKSWKLAMIAGAIAVSLLLGISEVVALLVGSVFGALWLKFSTFLPPRSGYNAALMGVIGGSSILMSSPVAAPVVGVSLWQLGVFFLKVGSVLFGSGYVLVAFLEGTLVREYQWLTQQQLLDAIAIGQFTPGPVLSTATFIGYIIAGLPGAIVATLGIFIPSFIFVAISSPLIPKLRSSPWTSAFLDAVNAGSVALMVVVTLQLGKGTLIDIPTCLISLWTAWGVFLAKVNSAWLILGGGLWGFLIVGLGLSSIP